MKKAMVALVLVLLAAAVSDARRRVIPIHVRMVTYIGAALEGDRPEFSWPVTCKGKPYQLNVLKFDVLDGRTSALNINSALAPYKTKFQVVGDNVALQRFTSTPPRQQVVITGYLRLDGASRMLSVDSVEGPAAAAPMPSS